MKAIEEASAGFLAVEENGKRLFVRTGLLEESPDSRS